MFGAGGFAAGSVITGVVGFKFRDQVRQLLGVSRPNIEQLGLATGMDDEWLLTPEDREELARHLADSTTAD
ncbi:hypothetical protein AVO44_10410 [Ruegeria profundi]|uniref:Uncharacterized protein n=2 Tax=Ruegeria profundi TaxID=1685378 RepID=A0A0X3TZL5_9RHOB|nr:hypothetical protein AVO44_10410 [Ruegeria profundi]